MRTITTHHTNACNRAVTIEADDPDPNNGNASHQYEAYWKEREGASPVGKMRIRESAFIQFQHGPIAEVGVNGITNEVLLAILIDRLEGFQSSKFGCVENAAALAFARNSLAALESRTKNREARGVEGTHEV